MLADLTSRPLLLGLQQVEYLEDGQLKVWNACIGLKTANMAEIPNEQ
ncbi:hypothetical protein GCM10025794_33190 [Massilia kyonggiensis]